MATKNGTTAKSKVTTAKRKAKSILTKATKAMAPKTTAKKKTTRKTKISREDLYQRTEQKAYEIFQLRGFSHGNDAFDWSIAEQLVTLEAEVNGKRKKKLPPESELMQRTEQKAYELFERKGYAHGNDYNDWVLARQIVELESSK